MICSGVYLVRFMVKAPIKSSRLRTLIHHGPVSGVNVSLKLNFNESHIRRGN
jgi:hypothetical protein